MVAHLDVEELDPLLDRDDRIGTGPAAHGITLGFEEKQGPLGPLDAKEVGRFLEVHEPIVVVKREIVELLHNSLADQFFGGLRVEARRPHQCERHFSGREDHDRSGGFALSGAAGPSTAAGFSILRVAETWVNAPAAFVRRTVPLIFHDASEPGYDQLCSRSRPSRMAPIPSVARSDDRVGMPAHAEQGLVC